VKGRFNLQNNQTLRPITAQVSATATPWRAPLAYLGLALLLPLAQAASLPPIPTPRDLAYPGTLTLSVDLTKAGQKVFGVHEIIPAKPGPLVLLYPKWIPGEHAPSGTLADTNGSGVAGIEISALGKRLAWHRDLLEPFALHVDVPPGADRLELEFQFLSATAAGNFGQGLSATLKLVDLEWNQVLFYPAGYFVRAINVQPDLTLPPGWGFGTALELSRSSDNHYIFEPLSLENLVDSPVIAGQNFKRVDLTPDGVPPVRLNIVADRPQNLELTPEQVKQHQALVEQAYALFGARHYRHYDFLLTLSDATDHFGLEHHQSSDDRAEAEFFTDSNHYLRDVDLLPHEYVHSWNGKFRRPEGLITPNFNIPMKDDLLWVYEGLTQYWGTVLAARAGMCSVEQFREWFAYYASQIGYVRGRAWQSLQDTADEAPLLYYVPNAWDTWRRSTDFYEEGALLWLDVDTTIRQLSHGSRSLDDFARAFYGSRDSERGPLSYTFDDVVAALRAVQPYDWASFLRAHLDSTDSGTRFDGLARGGWQLAYTGTQSSYLKARDQSTKTLNLIPSIGLLIDNDKSSGTLIDVLWDGPAFQAGLAPGMKLIAVNGESYSPEILKDALQSAQGGSDPINLLVQSDTSFLTVKVNYHDGARYARLERSEGAPDLLTEIAKPRPPPIK
jgi:predicted metalloprotease with PDZ domain